MSSLTHDITTVLDHWFLTHDPNLGHFVFVWDMTHEPIINLKIGGLNILI